MFTSGGKVFKIFSRGKRIQWYGEVIWTLNKEKMRFWKYFIAYLLRYRPQAPQSCPMGPKFLVQNFSLMMPYSCCSMTFSDLLAKNWSFMPKTGHFCPFWPLSKNLHVFGIKLQLFANKSQIVIKQHLYDIIRENFWTKNFGPMGLP